MSVKIIATDKAPRAVGAYSQAVLVDKGKLLFVSGQIALHPGSMEMVDGGVEAQTRQVMENLGAILTAAGGSFASIIKATVYLADINDFAAVNEIYASCFKSAPPARAAFAVAGLPRGALVEIEAIAAL